MTNQVLRKGLVDYLPQIRRVVGKIAKYEDIVDDVSQEVCVRVIEKEKLWSQQENKLNSWINTITRNLTISYISRKKEKTLEGKEDGLPCPDDEQLFSEEQIKWVVKHFFTLSEKQRQVLHMRYYRNMTTIQIGKELKTTQQTASYHINSALKDLRKKAHSQGFLALLLPWQWNFKVIQNLILFNKPFGFYWLTNKRAES